MVNFNFDIAFVISHKPDIRYQKRLDALNKKYKVAIIYWNKDSTPIDFEHDGVKSYEVCIPADKTNPLKRLPQTFLFIKKAYEIIKRIQPRCLYVGNLDMLYIATLYKKRNMGCKVIYEIADLHRLIVDKQKGVKSIVSKVLKYEEVKFSNYVDVLVLTSMKFFDVYYKDMISEDKVVFMPNMPDEDVFTGFQKKPHGKFTIGFVGVMRYREQLKLLINSAEKTNVRVVFAGEDRDGTQFEDECKKYDFVEYRGAFNYRRDIKSIYSDIDLIYSVYDADMANVRVALPNKLYESVFTGIPIVVAKNTYLSELVKEMGIGTAVSHKEMDDLVAVIDELSTMGETYKGMVDNCNNLRSTQNLEYYNKCLVTKLDGIMSK